MRHAAALALCLGLVTGSAEAAPGMLPASGTAMPAITKVEYYCSPGFEPSYGGTCVAVASRAEVELYVEHPLIDEPVVLHRHRRHRTLRERF